MRTPSSIRANTDACSRPFSRVAPTSCMARGFSSRHRAGICGDLSFDRSRPVSADAVRAMRDQLTHRGPDSHGIFVSPDGAAALGFRRLRIIDLTPSANQPMPNEDASVHLVFNGEIYNFQ